MTKLEELARKISEHTCIGFDARHRDTAHNWTARELETALKPLLDLVEEYVTACRCTVCNKTYGQLQIALREQLAQWKVRSFTKQEYLIDKGHERGER